MKALFNLCLTFIMSTTFVFAKQTQIDTDKQISDVLNLSSQLKNQKSINSCDPRTQRTLVKYVNRSIEKEKKNPTSLDKAITKYQKRYSYVHYKKAKKTRRLLKRNRKLNRYYRKIKKSNPNITFKQMVANLKASRSIATKNMALAKIESDLIAAGSLLSHLENLKSKILDCSINELAKDGSDTWYLILLIIFIGLPVLAVIGIIIALIMGAFAWMLWFLIFAVAMVAILVIIAQFPPKDKKLDEPLLEV